MNLQRNNNVYFKNLDIVRFVSALMVVLLHGYAGFNSWIGAPEMLKPKNGEPLHGLAFAIDNLFKNFSFGVDVFFLISGFLITYLLLVEKNNFGKINVGNFYIRRALRIWPLYFLIVLISPLLISITGSRQPDYYAVSFFYYNFHYISSGGGEFPFGHFWSISVEEHFYLLLPLLLIIVNPKYYRDIFILLIAISIVSRYCIFTFVPQPYYQLFFNTLSNMDTLALGGLIGYWHFTKPITFNAGKLISFLTFLLLLLAFTLCERTAWLDMFSVIFTKYIYLGLTCVLFLYFMFGEHRMQHIKKPGIFHYLGKISYGIYVYHNILLFFVCKYIVAYNEQSWNWPFLASVKNSIWWFWFIYIAFTLLISVLSYELFEKKMLRLKDRFSLVKTAR